MGPPRKSCRWGFRAVTSIHCVDYDQIRIILCIRFDPRAPPREVASFKAGVIDSPGTLYSVESAGAFDFMVEVAPPDMASYSKWLKSIAEPVARLVQQLESSFVCKRFIRRLKEERALWVPCDDGFRRVDPSLIDKITADRDYVRVFSRGEAWMLHATMRSLIDRLSSKDFLQLHRSIIVRQDFIERLIRQKRNWFAQLRDGSLERVARTHIGEILQLTRRTIPRTGVVESPLERLPERERSPKIAC